MMQLLLHLFKSSIIIALFYVFYKILLSRETFFRTNRIVILSAFILSFCIPLLSFSVRELQIFDVRSSQQFLSRADESFPNADKNSLLLHLAVAFYVGGILLRLSFLFVGFLRIMKMIKRGETFVKDGYILVVTSENISPFSWWKYVFISNQDMELDTKIIESHEVLHLKNWHSLDLLFAEIATALLWFHPVCYLFKYELKNSHEFEVDAALLQQGQDPESYQMLLIRKAAASNGLSTINTFSQTKLGLRIKMMLRERSTIAAGIKYTGLLANTVLCILTLGRSVVEIESPRVLLRATSSEKEKLPSLYIIDGRESTMADFKALIPDSIKTISVLGEAEAVKRFNQHGTGDVIVVTTK